MGKPKSSSAGATTLFVLAMIASIVFLLGGFVSMSQATIGVGSVAIACYFAILARIFQASAHSDLLRKDD